MLVVSESKMYPIDAFSTGSIIDYTIYSIQYTLHTVCNVHYTMGVSCTLDTRHRILCTLGCNRRLTKIKILSNHLLPVFKW